VPAVSADARKKTPQSHQKKGGVLTDRNRVGRGNARSFPGKGGPFHYQKGGHPLPVSSFPGERGVGLRPEHNAVAMSSSAREGGKYGRTRPTSGRGRQVCFPSVENKERGAVQRFICGLLRRGEKELHYSGPRSVPPRKKFYSKKTRIITSQHDGKGGREKKKQQRSIIKIYIILYRLKGSKLSFSARREGIISCRRWGGRPLPRLEEGETANAALPQYDKFKKGSSPLRWEKKRKKGPPPSINSSRGISSHHLQP